MKGRLCFLIAALAWPFLAIADVNARNGVSINTASTINGATPNSAINGQTITSALQTETIVWRDGIIAAGGTFEANSIALADALVVQLKGKSYYSKILYLLPLFGADIIAARMPLIDTLAVGIATNTSFVNADFAQATGLQFSGTKRFNPLIKASQLGATGSGITGSGGAGVISLAMATTGWVLGTFSTSTNEIYGLTPTTTNSYSLWGDGNSAINSGVTNSGSNHHYIQCVSTTSRRLFKNGSQIGSTGLSSSLSESGDNPLLLGGLNGSNNSDGRCGGMYYTNGALSDPDISDLNTTLATYLTGVR